MELISVDIDRDLPEINSWYKARDLYLLKKEWIPPQGFIAPGIAAGFLIRTNTNLGILEHFVSNPAALKKDRRLAIDMIAGLLISAGKSMGILGFMALSSHPEIFKLCEKHGLVELNKRVFVGTSGGVS